MTPRLEACYFVRPGSDGRWDRLARVLEASARQHCAGWRITIARIEAPRPDAPERIQAFVSNTGKLDHWARVVAEAADGDRILLIDADTLIVQPLDAIWARGFDLAYTTKRDRFPINGGVVFLTVTDRVRAFMARWAEENRRLLADANVFSPWRFTHGGINQASLAMLIGTAAESGVDLLDLPCAEWNCEDSTWRSFDPAVTKILHVKSALRQACLSPFVIDPSLEGLRRRWLAQEADARSQKAGVR